MEHVFKLKSKQHVQHEGWLLKRGVGYDPDDKFNLTQGNRKLLKTLISLEGRGERRRYFILVTTKGDSMTCPKAMLYWFNKKPTVVSRFDKASELLGENAKTKDIPGYKGEVAIDDQTKVSITGNHVIRMVAIGRTYYLRPEDSLNSLEKVTTASQWQTDIDVCVKQIWKYKVRMETPLANPNKTRMRKISTFVYQREKKEGELDEVPNTLDLVLKNSFYKKLFKQFCSFSLAAENLMFYDEVEEFERKARRDPLNDAAIRNFAEKIVNNYVKEGSPYQVNLSSQQRQDIVNKMEEETINHEIFYEGKAEVFNLMEKNFFRRFYLDEQRKTGTFAALYSELGLDGYNAVLAHFGPVQSDLDRVLRLYESTILAQVDQQINVIHESYQKSSGVAVPEFETTCDAVNQMFNGYALRLAILVDFKAELEEEVIKKLHALKTGMKNTLETIVARDSDVVLKIETTRKRFCDEAAKLEEIVSLSDRISKEAKQKGYAFQPRRLSKSDVGTSAMDRAAAFFKTATGQMSEKEKINEKLRAMGLTVDTVYPELKKAHAAARHWEREVKEVERLNANILTWSLDELESLESSRLEEKRRILKHAVLAQKDMYERMKEENERTLRYAKAIDVDHDIMVFANSIIETTQNA